MWCILFRIFVRRLQTLYELSFRFNFFLTIFSIGVCFTCDKIHIYTDFLCNGPSYVINYLMIEIWHRNIQQVSSHAWMVSYRQHKKHSVWLNEKNSRSLQGISVVPKLITETGWYSYSKRCKKLKIFVMKLMRGHLCQIGVWFF